MNDFDPAALFLLDMNWVNLFEPTSAAPGAIPRYRCKGCGAEVTQAEREKHHRGHKRARNTVERRRQEKIRRERVARLARARQQRAAA